MPNQHKLSLIITKYSRLSRALDLTTVLAGQPLICVWVKHRPAMPVIWVRILLEGRGLDKQYLMVIDR